MKGLLTAIGCVALLMYPETALNAAREAMYVWYASVAPAMFPFMALMPMLTCGAAAKAWERALGRWMRRVFRLPGSAAPAVAVGLIAGSPAGAHAVRRCQGLSREEKARLVCCTSGLSPAFLITGVGAGMLGSAADGHILFRAQLAAQLTMLTITRGMPKGTPELPGQEDKEVEPVRTAVTAVLSVCGYMMLFNTAAAIIAAASNSQSAGLAALCALDLPSAARAVANLPIIRKTKLIAIAALTGFGGLCITAQNLAAAGKCCKAGKYLAARACHALLNAGFAALQIRMDQKTPEFSLPAMEISALIAVFLLLPALISLKNDQSLNKTNFENSPRKRPEKRRKPQYNVE